MNRRGVEVPSVLGILQEMERMFLELSEILDDTRLQDEFSKLRSQADIIAFDDKKYEQKLVTLKQTALKYAGVLWEKINFFASQTEELDRSSYLSQIEGIQRQLQAAVRFGEVGEAEATLHRINYQFVARTAELGHAASAQNHSRRISDQILSTQLDALQKLATELAALPKPPDTWLQQTNYASFLDSRKHAKDEGTLTSLRKSLNENVEILTKEIDKFTHRHLEGCCFMQRFLDFEYLCLKALNRSNRASEIAAAAVRLRKKLPISEANWVLYGRYLVVVAKFTREALEEQRILVKTEAAAAREELVDAELVVEEYGEALDEILIRVRTSDSHVIIGRLKDEGVSLTSRYVKILQEIRAQQKEARMESARIRTNIAALVETVMELCVETQKASAPSPEEPWLRCVPYMQLVNEFKVENGKLCGDEMAPETSQQNIAALEELQQLYERRRIPVSLKPFLALEACVGKMFRETLEREYLPDLSALRSKAVAIQFRPDIYTDVVRTLQTKIQTQISDQLTRFQLLEATLQDDLLYISEPVHALEETLRFYATQIPKSRFPRALTELQRSVQNAVDEADASVALVRSRPLPISEYLKKQEERIASLQARLTEIERGARPAYIVLETLSGRAGRLLEEYISYILEEITTQETVFLAHGITTHHHELLRRTVQLVQLTAKRAPAQAETMIQGLRVQALDKERYAVEKEALRTGLLQQLRVFEGRLQGLGVLFAENSIPCDVAFHVARLEPVQKQLEAEGLITGLDGVARTLCALQDEIGSFAAPATQELIAKLLTPLRLQQKALTTQHCDEPFISPIDYVQFLAKNKIQENIPETILTMEEEYMEAQGPVAWLRGLAQFEEAVEALRRRLWCVQFPEEEIRSLRNDLQFPEMNREALQQQTLREKLDFQIQLDYQAESNKDLSKETTQIRAKLVHAKTLRETRTAWAEFSALLKKLKP